MKLIQSFWTKPYVKTGSLSGGWMEAKYHLFSWALSTNLLNEIYNEVYLYTDSLGKIILCDLLELPFSKVYTSLDDLHKYNSNLWTFGKVHTYGLQNEPFLHVDSDVFIAQKFPQPLMDGEIIFQNYDLNLNIYKVAYNQLKNMNCSLPKFITCELSESYCGLNAGIFGGNSVSRIKEYVAEVKLFHDQNKEIIDSMDVTNINIFLEQLFMYYYFTNKECRLNPLFPELDTGFQNYTHFWKIAREKNYIHLISFYKKKRQLLEQMEAFLRFKYPNSYYKSLDLINRYSFDEIN